MYIDHKIKKIQLGPFTTSEKELSDLFKAWLMISIAFAIVMYGFSFSFGFYKAVILSSLTVGIAFIFHELAHKLTAQHYGCFAEFRAFNAMLILALVMSFAGFVFAAPGAVMISGPVGTRRNGKISMAGPLSNLILAAIFLSIQLFLGIKFSYGKIENLPFAINTWIALFNLIPFGNFDGRKILHWNRWVYASMIVIALIFMAIF